MLVRSCPLDLNYETRVSTNAGERVGVRSKAEKFGHEVQVWFDVSAGLLNFFALQRKAIAERVLLTWEQQQARFVVT